MKIAIVYRRVGRGSAVPNYCWQLVRGLRESHETWIFAQDWDKPLDRVHTVRLPFRFRSKRVEYGLNSLVNGAIIGAYRLKFGFDVVHEQDGESIAGDVVTAHSLLREVYRR